MRRGDTWVPSSAVPASSKSRLQPYAEAAVELDDVRVREPRHDLALREHKRRLVLLADEALVHHFDGEVHAVLLHLRMEDLQ
jgi:hypothetical protein